MKTITTKHEDCEECNKLVEQALESLRHTFSNSGIDMWYGEDDYSHTATVLR